MLFISGTPQQSSITAIYFEETCLRIASPMNISNTVSFQIAITSSFVVLTSICSKETSVLSMLSLYDGFSENQKLRIRICFYALNDQLVLCKHNINISQNTGAIKYTKSATIFGL